MVTGLFFNMFSASFLENALFRSFVFSMFPAYDTLSGRGHIAAMQFVPNEASNMCHHPSLLLRAPGGKAKGQPCVPGAGEPTG
jgi:hypothetical protein